MSKASYGMYLSHVFFYHLVNYYLANIPLTGTQNALLIVVLSIINLFKFMDSLVITSKIPLIKKKYVDIINFFICNKENYSFFFLTI